MNGIDLFRIEDGKSKKFGSSLQIKLKKIAFRDNLRGQDKNFDFRNSFYSKF